MKAFVAEFLPSNLGILRAKDSRFVDFLRKAEAGTMFDRPATCPTWSAYIKWGAPIFGKLQAKEDDVRHEMDVIRHATRRFEIVFVGTDGLGVVRMNTILNKDPSEYLSAPMVIPVQGEAPHGIFHIMHAHWRLYLPLIRKCAKLLGADVDKAVLDDPTMKAYNISAYHFWRVTRAVAEYVAEISKTPGALPLSGVENLFSTANSNFDFVYLLHFLYDAAFHVLEFKQAVRGNDGDTLDRAWKEFLPTARTSKANKTLYAPMAILRIFWARAMNRQLQDLYRELRTIPMSLKPGRRVGHDTPCEWLNKSITLGVRTRVTEAAIEDFVTSNSFVEHSYQMLREQLGLGLKDRERKMKNMDKDVDTLKQAFRSKIGSTWLQVIAPCPNSKFNLGAARPWANVKAENSKPDSANSESLPAFIARHVKSHTCNFFAFNP